jgi:hypothetical protein
LRDFHNIPIILKKHASRAISIRFKMNAQDVVHYIKTARVIKDIDKDGNIGILQSDIGDRKIQFICTIRERVLYIITVEECK